MLYVVGEALGWGQGVAHHYDLSTTPPQGLVCFAPRGRFSFPTATRQKIAAMRLPVEGAVHMWDLSACEDRKCQWCPW